MRHGIPNEALRPRIEPAAGVANGPMGVGGKGRPAEATCQANPPWPLAAMATGESR